MLDLGRCLLPDILEELGWTIQDLANRTKLSRTQIADWCSNRYVMSLKNAMIVSEAVGRPIPSLYEVFRNQRGR